MRIIFVITFVLLSILNYGQKQNPAQYARLVNKAELAICDSNYKAAINYYKQAFRYLKEPFGNDISNFLYCGFLRNDTSVLHTCLPKYKERNYRTPSWAAKEYKGTFIANYWDSIYLHSSLTSKIDTVYRNFLKDLEKKDQAIRNKTENMTWDEIGETVFLVDSVNMKQLIDYIDSTGIFPTEAVVGNEYNIASNPTMISLLLAHAAYIDVAMHYTIAPPNLHLDQRVLSGDFPPDLYASLCDYRGYGIDGNLPDSFIQPFGGDIVFVYPEVRPSNYNKEDPKTWGCEMRYTHLTSKQMKAVNKKRAAFYMDPFNDLLKKIEFQMLHLNENNFILVPTWYIAFTIN